MYLKRLELQGFKSFAPRTSMEFNPGITAIVGPNGSGKSNLADAIRWVLGEQSMRQLRGKKSDDIIFAGGQGRAPMQMAEVGLVLDNSAGWLPNEHSEVTAARRSFRSGETEYLLNGQRVRLKDLLLLLAQARIGHDSYTVIGQGLVDQALSLRAEERRGLFEDAAGIRQFQAQRADAEQKLALTVTNLSRLHDIIGEIEPRLGPLAEQARRAREYSGTRDELTRLLRGWYAWQWHEALATRERTTVAEAELAERIEHIRAAMADGEVLAAQTRETRDARAARIAELRRARGEATGRIQALERDHAVAEERRASLDRQAADLESDQEAQEAALAAARAHADVLEEQVAHADAQADALAAQVDALGSAQHSARQQQEQEEARLRAAQRDAVQAQARLGAAQTELGRLQRQLGERNRALAQRQDAAAAAQRRADAANTALEGHRTAFDAARREVEGLAGQREELQRELASGQEDAEQARGAFADAQRERRGLADRLALIEEWQRTLGGYAEAVRAVLQAPEHERPTVIGVLARLVRVTPGYEPALEAALGPFLQALVATSMEDALACAQWLRARGAGQALLIWPPRKPTSAQHGPLEPGNMLPVDGTRIHESTLAYIQTQDELRPLLQRLLYGVYVVSDLGEAYRILADQGGRRRHSVRALATLDGEVLHVDDWLRGGGQQVERDGGSGAPHGSARESTLLARERELRQLPSEIERWDAEIAEAQARLARASQAQQERRERAAALERESQRAEARAQELARELAAAQREAERAHSEQQLSQAVADQLAAEIAGVEQEVAATEARVAEQEAAQQETAERVRELQEALDDLMASHRAQQEELARARTALALQRQEAKAIGQRAEQLRAQASELATQIERRAERVQAIATQRAQLDEATAQQQQALAELRTRTRELNADLQAQEAALADAERELGRIERQQSLARQEIATAEGQYRQRIVEAQRARDAVETLATQIREEMSELVASEAESDADRAEAFDPERLFGLGADAQNADAEGQHLAPEEAAKLRRQIDQLRSRLRHLGGYDPDAPQQYEELQTRYDFLTAQVRDMEQASANLRTIIAELDATMRRQFAETFEAVNLRFQRHFTTLFNGGTARLELTAPRRHASDEDAEEEASEPAVASRPPALGGVEIFVQIPGKRVQDLSLLSGGERAMVSAALLFALLETNPPPFCLLDEVDAALDEANVVRFCDILTALAHQTQFVVITHNRVTMTHAGAIYGISMGADSVSRVLSMRLAEVPAGR